MALIPITKEASSSNFTKVIKDLKVCIKILKLLGEIEGRNSEDIAHPNFAAGNFRNIT